MTADLSALVDLTQARPFRLGKVEVNPATGELIWKTGREVLQPRVMQVLVTLATRRGQVVSRDELIAACWGGRAVGEDAINRCISDLRRRAERSGGFHVETFPRVGYRLSEGDAPAAARAWPVRLTWGSAALAVVLVLGALVLTLWITRAQPPAALPPARVQVMPLQIENAGPEAQAFAEEFGAEITGVLNESGVQTTQTREDRPARGADLTLHGVISRQGDTTSVRMFLDDPRAGLTLWSDRFERAGNLPQLRQQVAVAATEAIYIALEPRLQKGLKLDPEVLALHIRASRLVTQPRLLREGEARQALEQVVARAPDFANGHGVLAVALANEVGATPPAERPALARRVEAEAATAIRIDPFAAGAAYDARHLLHRRLAPTDLVTAEDLLLEGLRQAPEFPFLSMRECRFLTEVGRAGEALRYCQRAIALRPLAGPIGYTYARALNAHGDRALAEQAIERAIRRNPDHMQTRLVRFQMAAFDGSADRARELLHDPTTVPQFFEPEAVAALDSYLVARKSKRTQDADRAVVDLRRAVANKRLDFPSAVMAVSTLNRVDDAFDMLAGPAYEAALASGGATFLMDPSTAPLRRDSRFWAVADHVGMLRYWKARAKWPDFCHGASTPEDCQRAMATQP